MGCGKTTVGKALAQELGMSFTDLDELIVTLEKRTIPEIFSQSGEEYFRSCEAALIKKLAADSTGVVALGGGAVLRKENADAARHGGEVIFIDTPFDLCYKRICGDSNRPLAANADRDELYQRYLSRLSAYRSAATVTVCGSDAPPIETVRQIILAVG